jgi:hypothetical protein
MLGNMKTLTLLACSFIVTTAFGHMAWSDAPKVTQVSSERSGMGWKISVTLTHPDTGWEHFADGWEILDRLGNQIGYRELMHPHVNEQPFTRSLFDVMIPDGEREIFIRTRCSEHGWSDDLIKVTVNR